MHRCICGWYLFLILTVVVCEPSDFNIHGVVKPGWEFVQELFRDNFVHDRDLGASVAVYYQDSLAFELAGGWIDQSRTKAYDVETLQMVLSTTNGLVAAAVALAVQRGLLDYSTLVTQYWPEYGQNGKENTTVSDILSHRTGLIDTSDAFEHYLNWNEMVHALEQRMPIQPPGLTQSHYTKDYGWLAGELIRRVDPKKRSLGQFIREEISNPIILDFFVGLPIDQDERVSPLEIDATSKGDFDSSFLALVNFLNEPRVRRAEIPALNGIATAWSIARFYSSLINDLNDHKYKRLLNEDILALATQSKMLENKTDDRKRKQHTFGMGFTLFDDVFPELGPGSFGHAGIGGSIGVCVPSKNFSFAYVTNRLKAILPHEDQRIRPILKKVVDHLS